MDEDVWVYIFDELSQFLITLNGSDRVINQCDTDEFSFIIQRLFQMISFPKTVFINLYFSNLKPFLFIIIKYIIDGGVINNRCNHTSLFRLIISHDSMNHHIVSLSATAGINDL